MKIVQLLPALALGDGVGNDTFALLDVLLEMGYESKIYAVDIDARIHDTRVDSYSHFPRLSAEDVVIFHMAISSQLTWEIEKLPCKKIMIYHNVTPPQFAMPYNRTVANLCQDGLREAAYLADKFDYVLADSQFNRQDLLAMGYTCPIDVLPILVPFADYQKPPSRRVLRTYRSDAVNILFTGRIAPNKKQENIIRAFYYYKKYIRPDSRLFLVGSYAGMESYYQSLCGYVQKLKLSDVYFTGRVAFDEILAYYRMADVFLCMSEHEGFCIPLLEAMTFDVPVIAYDSTAVGETLGGSGILLDTNDPRVAAEMIEQVLTKEDLKSAVLYNQRLRLADFSYETVRDMFIKYLMDFLDKGKDRQTDEKDRAD